MIARIAIACFGLMTGTLAQAQHYKAEHIRIEADFDVLESMFGESLYDDPTAVAREVMSVPVAEWIGKQNLGVDVIRETVHIRGDMLRHEERSGEEEGIYGLFDLETGTMTYVRPDQKVYMQWTLADVEQSTADAEAIAAEALREMGIDPDDLEATSQGMDDEYMDDEYDVDEEFGIGTVIGSGVTETINGIRAVSHEVVDDVGVVTVTWCADATGAVGEMWDAFSAMPAMEEDDDAEEGVCGDGLPVRTQTYDSQNVSYELYELVSVDEGKLPVGLFEIPADYAETDMYSFGST